MPKEADKAIIGQKSIDTIKPTSARKEYPDATVKGLYLVVQPSGVMSWALRYRHPVTRKPRKFTLGGYPALSIKGARAMAFSKLGDVAEGVDLGAERAQRKAKALDTSRLVSSQVKSYFKLHVEKKHRPNTAAQVKGIFKNDVLPKWGNKRIDDISKRDVVLLLNAKAETAPYMANRMQAYLKHFGGWLVSQGVLTANFADGVEKPAKETSRERVLNTAEIKALWAVASNEGYPFGDMARLLLLTGARKNEIARLRWNEISIETRELIIASSRMKGDNAHSIPLSDTALEIINSLPRFSDSKDAFVFTTNGKTSVSGFSRFKSRLDRKMKARLGDELEPWRLHDIRRTAASEMAALQISPHVVEAALAHLTGQVSGIAKVYNRHVYADEKRTALNSLSNRIQSLVGDGDSSNVVALHG